MKIELDIIEKNLNKLKKSEDRIIEKVEEIKSIPVERKKKYFKRNFFQTLITFV
jgi:hypothetical protein